MFHLIRFCFAAGLCLFCACDDSDLKQVASDAFSLTEKIVTIGPRAPGSTGIEKVRTLLRSIVAQQGLVMQEQLFEADSPLGPIQMKNLYVDIPGNTKYQVLLGAHYDSKLLPKINFVGANDAASSVALLLSFIKWLKAQSFHHTIRLVFFDGEEALRSWSSRDSLYGSRAYVRYAEHLSSLRAVLILDMISDHHLELIRSSGSDATMMSYLEEVMGKLGLQKHLAKVATFVDDDHQPFLKKGVPTLHLMDFTFGGDDSPGLFWHTSNDNMENVSQASLLKISSILMGLLPKIDQRR